MITGVGGGIIRDVLAREIPMILRTEIPYATACIIGGIVHATAFYTFSVPLESASMAGYGGHAVHSGWRPFAGILKLPTFAPMKTDVDIVFARWRYAYRPEHSFL